MDDEKLRQNVERQVRRMQKAKKEQPTLLAQTVFLGTLTLVFVLPVILGAYLGHWLDEKMEGYSIHWTIGLILLGLVVGGFNAYLYFREHE